MKRSEKDRWKTKEAEVNGRCVSAGIFLPHVLLSTSVPWGLRKSIGAAWTSNAATIYEGRRPRLKIERAEAGIGGVGA